MEQIFIVVAQIDLEAALWCQRMSGHHLWFYEEDTMVFVTSSRSLARLIRDKCWYIHQHS